MKQLISFILIAIIFSCCNHKRSEESNILEVYPRSEIKILMDSFIQFSNDTSLIYEIYVDKIAHWDYDIVLYSGKKSLTEKRCAIMKTSISGIKFDIYSGLEHFFGNQPNLNDTIIDTPPLEGAPDGNYWIITDRRGVISIIKDSWTFPFQASQRIEFEMPEGNENYEEPEWVVESLGRKE